MLEILRIHGFLVSTCQHGFEGCQICPFVLFCLIASSLWAVSGQRPGTKHPGGKERVWPVGQSKETPGKGCLGGRIRSAGTKGKEEMGRKNRADGHGPDWGKGRASARILSNLPELKPGTKPAQHLDWTCFLSCQGFLGAIYQVQVLCLLRMYTCVHLDAGVSTDLRKRPAIHPQNPYTHVPPWNTHAPPWNTHLLSGAQNCHLENEPRVCSGAPPQSSGYRVKETGDVILADVQWRINYLLGFAGAIHGGILQSPVLRLSPAQTFCCIFEHNVFFQQTVLLGNRQHQGAAIGNNQDDN